MKRYLIYQFACFGDCLYATTVARQLKHDDPECHVTWAISKRYRSILDGNPHVDAVLELEIDPKHATAEDFRLLETESKALSLSGGYDEVIHLQIFNRHLRRFHTTLRSTVFKIFGRPITVQVAPIVVLNEAEMTNVAAFARHHELSRYRHVILFECSPSSGQSPINTKLACRIARRVIGTRHDACFVLTSTDEIDALDKHIISASSISFRENLGLLNHCTMLIGCSSGITWLATAESAPRMPILQLLSEDSDIFAGVSFDFQIHGLDSQHIIETTSWTESDVVECICLVMEGKFGAAREKFHRMQVPSKATLKRNLLKMARLGYSYRALREYASDFIRENRACGNNIRISWPGISFLILQNWISLMKYSARAWLHDTVRGKTIQRYA